MKPDLDGSNYTNESVEATLSNQQRIANSQYAISLAQWGIKRVQCQKCTYRIGEIHCNVNMATLPHQLHSAYYTHAKKTEDSDKVKSSDIFKSWFDSGQRL